MRYTCERCKHKFSSWLQPDNGEYVVNICISCYYKVVNLRELQIQEIVEDTLAEHDLKTAIGVYQKLMFPDEKKKKKKG